VPVALALAAVVIGLTAAGVFLARQLAGQRIEDRATAAHSLFEQSLGSHPSHRQIGAAARVTSRGLGVGVSVPSIHLSTPDPAGGSRDYGYAVPGAGRVVMSVSTHPLATATRTALVTGLGLGAGALMLLVALTLNLFDRRLARPLTRLAGAAERVARGDNAARADERGPAELWQAARSLNALIETVVDPPRDPSASDPLTGVLGTDQFHELLGIELKRAERERSSVGLVVLDVDGFGAINDAHGRAFGDETLKLVARRLRRVMRATDLLARVGGDDFALILPGADARLALGIAERARAAVAAGSTSEQQLSCSAGVVCYPEDARDGSTLLQLAGGALDWAKRSGHDTSRRYDPKEISLPTDEEERAELEVLLEREAPLFTVFQPLVSLSTGKVLGYEALSRFPEPPGRAPDSWFSQAARCGMGPRLEALALRAALGREGRPAGTFLSVNVSPSALASREVQAALPRDMTGIVVEITEQEVPDDLDALEAHLAELRLRGARIALDDAGAGYSGLQQVMRVQPDIIKLDRSLVQGVHEDPAKEALIDSFVRFARRTGASVLAEGIETMDELRLLADLDVSYGQGFALARPAEHWGGVSPSVSEALLRRSLRVASKEDMPDSGDQRLEYVSAQLSRISSSAELEEVFTLIADELGADGVCFSRWLRDEHCVETVVDTSEPEDSGRRYNLSRYPSTCHVLDTGEAVQVLASDPGADLGEVSLLGQMGFQSLLMVPVVCRGERLGLFEAYSTRERPWTRSEINRARIISYQLGPVLEALSTHA
jgi:diguanylate cyclase (GGDEF)-like protein